MERQMLPEMKLSVHILDLLALRSHSFPVRLALQRIDFKKVPKGASFQRLKGQDGCGGLCNPVGLGGGARARASWGSLQPEEGAVSLTVSPHQPSEPGCPQAEG